MNERPEKSPAGSNGENPGRARQVKSDQSGPKSRGQKPPPSDLKAEQAGLLWYLLPGSYRRKVAKLLSLKELDELNRGYQAYKKLPPARRALVEEEVGRDTRFGFTALPLTFFFILGVVFIVFFVSHLTTIPNMDIQTRFYVFTPLLLGVFAPLTLYLMPRWRIRALFRFEISSEAMITTFVGLLLLVWLLFFINDATPSGYRGGGPKGITLLIICLGAGIAPLLEEVLFREFIPAMFDRPPHYIGHAVAAVLFSVAHVPNTFLIFFLYTLTGLVFAVVRVRTGGLLYPLIIHSLANEARLLLF